MTTVDNTDIYSGPAIWIAVNILGVYNLYLVVNLICSLGQLACKYPTEQSKMPPVPEFWTFKHCKHPF